MGTLVTLVVGIIIGFLIGWGIYGRESGVKSEREGRTASSTLDFNDEFESDFDLDDETPVKSGSLSSPSATVGGTTASFSVSAQAAGLTVNVMNVKADAPTWVAVRDYRGGQLGNVLGARRIEQSQAGVAVQLLRSTKAGETYAVVLYRDNGDKLFSHQTDTLVTANGAAVVGTFTVR